MIEINENRCDGCGACVTSCKEGAIQIINGKATVVNDAFCDGLGACIGHCPQDALHIIEKETVVFDEAAALNQKPNEAPCGCTGSATRDFAQPTSSHITATTQPVPSALTHWPIQLHLIQPTSPHFKYANLVIAADCTAFSFSTFHTDFLKGKKLIIACPKLDDHKGYAEKLITLFQESQPASITVVRMEVPCCTGLTHLVQEAINQSGKRFPFLEVVIGIQGEIKAERN